MRRCIICNRRLFFWARLFHDIAEIQPGAWVCSADCYLTGFAAYEIGLAETVYGLEY